MCWALRAPPRRRNRCFRPDLTPLRFPPWCRRPSPSPRGRSPTPCLAWLRLLALDGDLARAEPKTLRYKILHAAARLVRSARRRQLKIQASWPWAHGIVTAFARLSALAQAP